MIRLTSLENRETELSTSLCNSQSLDLSIVSKKPCVPAPMPFPTLGMVASQAAGIVSPSSLKLLSVGLFTTTIEKGNSHS